MKLNTCDSPPIVSDALELTVSERSGLTHGEPLTQWLEVPLVSLQACPLRPDWALAEEIARKVIEHRGKQLRRQMAVRLITIQPVAQKSPSRLSRFFTKVLPAFKNVPPDNADHGVTEHVEPLYRGLHSSWRLAA